MIAVKDEDIVLRRDASDGRFILFTSTDVQPAWPIRWWGAVADTGGDGWGLLVRLDPSAAPEGWTARQLIAVLKARYAVEASRCKSNATSKALGSVEQALACLGPGVGETNVEFGIGALPSPYSWTEARIGEFILPLCPDPESRDEGVTPEQVLIVLDQLLKDGAKARPWSVSIRRASGLISAALRAEQQRVSSVGG
jgi:hypothetical protein